MVLVLVLIDAKCRKGRGSSSDQARIGGLRTLLAGDRRASITNSDWLKET